jgi:hypothetical protein
MTPRIGTRPRPAPLRIPQRAIDVVLAMAGVVAILLLAPSLRTGPHIPRLTVANQTLFHINVDLADSDRDRWFQLGTVSRETDGVLEEIPDMGGTWVFRFSYAGVPAGELVLSRPALVEAGWAFAVPADVGARLAGAGLSPSAR